MYFKITYVKNYVEFRFQNKQFYYIGGTLVTVEIYTTSTIVSKCVLGNFIAITLRQKLITS